MPLCAYRAGAYISDMDTDCDILISGAGIAGLTAAAAFGSAGYRVICVDPAPPVTDAHTEGADMRTTAILQPGRDTLERAGLWSRLAPHAAALEVMRIIDASDPDRANHVTKDFKASDISDAPFGWNLPNWLLRREILAHIEALDTVTFRPGIATTGYLSRTRHAAIRLSDGSRIQAKLVIGADGRNSALRRAARIPVQRHRYGQKALAFSVQHSQPHQNISTEIHQSGGPLTLVPLPDRNGQPASAVVWMDDGPRQLARSQIQVPAFETALTERSCEVLGPLTLATNRTVWPIISQHAARLVAPRLALVAEAAHVLPPIGAQGLNMSLKDISTLTDLVDGAQDPGDADLLARYERARLPDIRLRIAGIDLLNRASQVSSPFLQRARAHGLNALYSVGPLRKNIMQLGLGIR